MKTTKVKRGFLNFLAGLPLLLSLSCSPLFGQLQAEYMEMEGGSYGGAGREDEMNGEEVREIQEEIRANTERLIAEGRLPMLADGPVRFGWPMKKASGLPIFNIGTAVSYVDHAPGFPDQLLDWNCGTRTYDGGIQQNHQGTDIISNPFPWRQLEENEAYAVAAAPGVITVRRDGFFDRNCAVGNPDWNLIVLRHSDGSITWYGHLKNGSVTQKKIGDMVENGEFLGVVGSSGSSRIPHVHFQVYNAASQLQDPYAGPCNSMNNFSWWEVQEPYRNSQILALTTGSIAPDFPACPMPENPNERIVYQPQDQIVTTAYYRDQLIGSESQHSLLKPDGSSFVSWAHVSPATYNTLRYWFRTWTLPADAPAGRWTYRVMYNAQTYETYFYVGQPPEVSAKGRITSLSGNMVNGASIVLSNAKETRIARSNPFGYYQIDNLVVGNTYEVAIRAKGLSFLPRVITIGEPLDAFDHFSVNDR